MALEIKDLLKELEIPEEYAEKTIDDFKQKLTAKWIGREVATQDDDIISKITGKRFGAAESKIIRDFGIDKKDIEGKKFEDIIDLAVTSTKTKIQQLEEAGKSGNDEKVTKLTKDLEKITSERDQFKNTFESFKTEAEQKESQYQSQLKGQKVNFHLSSVKSSIPFIQGTQENAKQIELARRGFDSVINEEYEFDFNDQEEFVVKSKKDGKLIEKPNKSGFLTPAELLTQKAQEFGVLKMNDTPPRPGVPAARPQPGDQKPLREVAGANRRR